MKPARKRKMLKAAARAPRWVRDIAAANFDPHGERRHREGKLGTFGPASAVRHIDLREYAAPTPTEGQAA